MPTEDPEPTFVRDTVPALWWGDGWFCNAGKFDGVTFGCGVCERPVVARQFIRGVPFCRITPSRLKELSAQAGPLKERIALFGRRGRRRIRRRSPPVDTIAA